MLYFIFNALKTTLLYEYNSRFNIIFKYRVNEHQPKFYYIYESITVC